MRPASLGALPDSSFPGTKTTKIQPCPRAVSALPFKPSPALVIKSCEPLQQIIEQLAEGHHGLVIPSQAIDAAA